MGLAATWLRDGDGLRHVSADSTLLGRDREALRDMTWARRPCRRGASTALGDGVCGWYNAGRAERLVRRCVDRCVAAAHLALGTVGDSDAVRDCDQSLH